MKTYYPKFQKGLQLHKSIVCKLQSVPVVPQSKVWSSLEGLGWHWHVCEWPCCLLGKKQECAFLNKIPSNYPRFPSFCSGSDLPSGNLTHAFDSLTHG